MTLIITHFYSAQNGIAWAFHLIGHIKHKKTTSYIVNDLIECGSCSKLSVNPLLKTTIKSKPESLNLERYCPCFRSWLTNQDQFGVY